MTVTCFNNDHAYHTVTTVSNGSNLSREKFNSGFIPMDGGSYIHTFNKVGKYSYYDQQHSFTHGIMTVTGGIEKGKNLNVLIGRKIPFNPNELSHVLLCFVPTTISIPSNNTLTYKVTMSKSNGKPIFGHNYINSYGILDLELAPMK